MLQQVAIVWLALFSILISADIHDVTIRGDYYRLSGLLAISPESVYLQDKVSVCIPFLCYIYTMVLTFTATLI